VHGKADTVWDRSMWMGVSSNCLTQNFFLVGLIRVKWVRCMAQGVFFTSTLIRVRWEGALYGNVVWVRSGFFD